MPEKENEENTLQNPHIKMDRQTKKLIAKTILNVDRKTPVDWLNPEAHEDALKTGKELWVEAMKLLKNSDYASVIAANGQHYAIFDPRKNQDAQAPEGSDLAIITSSSESEEVDGEDVEYLNAKNYYLTPKGVILIEKNSASALVRGQNEPRPNKKTAIKKQELGKDEISEILNIIKAGNTSQPLLQRNIHTDVNQTEESIQNLRKEINSNPLKKFILGMRRRFGY